MFARSATPMGLAPARTWGSQKGWAQTRPFTNLAGNGSYVWAGASGKGVVGARLARSADKADRADKAAEHITDTNRNYAGEEGAGIWRGSCANLTQRD